MNMPPVRYVTTRDGFNLAYLDEGSGRPIVFVPSRMSHLSRTWTRFGAWVRPLAESYRLIHYDPRGQGLSTRGLSPLTSVQTYVDDLKGVVDHLGLERVSLLGHGMGGHVALCFAAAHPKRVEALLMVGVTIQMSGWLQPLWRDVARANWEFFLRSLMPASVTDPEDVAAYVAALKECESFEDYQIATDAAFASSVEDVLPAIEAPVLVMHPRNFTMLARDEGPRLAAALSNARLKMLAGEANDFMGDPAEFAAAIAEFFSLLDSGAGASPARMQPVPQLSSREIEVLRLLVGGKSNRQIADELTISWHTAAKHVSSILNKTGAANRTEVAAFATRYRLI